MSRVVPRFYTYFMKASIERSLTITLLLTKLVTSSLSPGTKRSFESLFSSNNLPIHDRDLVYPIDFPIFVEFDSGFDVDMLSFWLIGGVIRI